MDDLKSRVEALETAVAKLDAQLRRTQRGARRWRLGALAAVLAGSLFSASGTHGFAAISETKKPKPPTTTQRLATLEEAVFGASPVLTGTTDRISKEVTRAEAAEGALAATVGAETSRAEAAEGTLATNLSAETSRAEAAEATVSGELNTVSAAPALALTQAEVNAMSTLQNFAAVAPFFSLQGSGDVFLTGANLHVVNGLGATNGEPNDPVDVTNPVVNGLGNLFIGYNETGNGTPHRTGSHNLVVGSGHNYSSFGGFVAGRGNTISGPYVSVTGGAGNNASAFVAVVSGGSGNAASGDYSSITGGLSNQCTAQNASVSGGQNLVQGNISGWSGGGLTGAGTFHSP